MNKLMCSFLFLLMAAASGIAQDTTIIVRSDRADTIITYGGNTQEGYSYDRDRRRSGIDFFYSRWGMLDLGVSILSPEEDYRLDNGVDPFEQRIIKSTNVNIHFFKVRLKPKAKGKLSLDFGPTLEIFKYFFENPIVMQGNQPEVTIDYMEGVNYRKNRLTATYLTMPLMLSFHSNPRRPIRSFHLAFGIDAGFLVGANFKTRLDGNKEKVKDNFNLSQWRSDLRLEVGFGPVLLYGSMGLRNVFDEDQDAGYKIKPFSVGFVVLPF